MPEFISVSDMDPVIRDMSASVIYWRQIDKEVDSVKERLGIDIKETSNVVNDTFLKTNGETGLESYNVPDSIYVRYYLTYIGAENV